jgi:hypothetical protein
MTDRANNRAAMPICAAAVDQVRAMYGEENVKVRWLSEGGKEIGKRPVETAYECERFDEVLRSLDSLYASIDKKGRK